MSGHERVEVEGLELVQPQLALPSALRNSLNAGPYSGRAGWFSTGYGPFRRLTGGGGEENMSILYGGGREARHLTLFRESAALTNVERWLTDLHSRAVDPALPEPMKQSAQRDLEVTRELLRTLLPQGVEVEEVSSLGVTFRSPLGARVGLNQLSDGYRSFLALVIDLLKQLADSGGLGVTHDATGAPVIPAEGVVLIDEADTHLHPSWQRDLGFHLCKVFPKLQFIVTSHSPFVAQAARPDGLFLVRKDADGAVTITPSDRSVRGWRADQILLSDLFGLESTRDPETDALLAEHDSLASLVAPDAAALARREVVRALLAERLTAPGDSLAERERSREMAALVEARLRRLRGDTP
ncbi:MAG: AAA family ATPase [Deltaproteobacteria bacterium]|nr:AAA family ATPase [Deltaproteobacteria bacterium]